jgi:hypothetical protein
MERVELKNREAISKAITSANNAAVKSCQDAQLITQEVSRDYQNAVADLRGKLADAKRLRPNSCIEVYSALAASRRNAASLAAKLPREDAGIAQKRGVNSDDLLDFAGDAEEARLRLIACQDFNRKEGLVAQKLELASNPVNCGSGYLPKYDCYVSGGD